ncbi:MAG: ATP-dependent DNA helicase PcrA [Candidatus Meridianibacter frigidus]|nr:MAG: ATP-dependent DNA helicase PcrA [Candidatus Eremiobacteraeota bacterium]
MIADSELLNDIQTAAVQETNGPVLIFAGAGSGKTRVLTHRIAHLLNQLKVFPDRILAVTFTNKAAGEMKARLERMVGDAARDLWVGTFHSMCVRILRRDGKKIGVSPNFGIIDEADQRALLRDILADLDYDERQLTPGACLAEISKAKNVLQTPKQYLAKHKSFIGERHGNVFKEYERRLAESNSLDFDDLIVKTINLLEEDEDVRTRYQNKFRYVLVDEYQDVNYAQYRLLRLFSGEHKNITVVGDDDQSIYSWRGSDYKMILNFEQDFPGAKIFKMEENYRSTPTILEAANALVENNKTRHPKKLFTSRSAGETVTAFRADTERAEARYVVEKIKDAVREGAAYRDFLVLYRTNAQSRVFEEAMISEGIPYRVVGGVGFYARQEIKDIVSYLRYILNPSDALAFKRIVNVPRRSIGAQTLASLIDAANAAKVSVGEAVFDKELLKRAVPKKQRELEKFAELVSNWRERFEAMTIADLLVAVMEESGYVRELQNEDTNDSRTRLENLQELVGVAREFEANDPSGTLADFLGNIALISDLDALDPASSYVTLMTMHGAKGLEFPVVFLTGLEEGVFPHNRALVDMSELEEERRLAYVGLTRAMEKLFLSYAERRTLFGNTFAHPKSRFLEEMPTVEMLGGVALARPAGGRWREVSIHENAGAGVGMDLQPGDKVRHPKWGEGTVGSMIGAGGDGLLTINFPNVGQKMVMLKYAPLEKL